MLEILNQPRTEIEDMVTERAWDLFLQKYGIYAMEVSRRLIELRFGEKVYFDSPEDIMNAIGVIKGELIKEGKYEE